MNIIISKSGKTIAMPYDTTLARTMVTKPVKHNGSNLIAAEYTDEVYELMRALKVDIKSPFELRYSWPKAFKPFDSQIRTATLLTVNKRAYVLSEMGCGKTISALAAADWLIQQGKVRRVLVVSPLSTLNLVWAREVFSFCPQYKAAVLHGTAQKRRDLLADKRFTIYIVNHDGLYIIADEIMRRADIDLIIIDELAEYRNGKPKQRRWRSMKDIAECKPRLWGMTGSPTPNAPTDAWAQCRLITPDSVPRYFGAFRDRVMRQVSQFRWVPRPEALERVHAVMQPSVRFKRSDVVELPPLTVTDRSVEMSPAMKKAYHNMLAAFVHEAKEGTITAANEAVRMGKLLQITAGLVYSDTGQIARIDTGARFQVLKEVIEETQGKLLVFAPFVSVIADVAQKVRQMGETVGVVYGATSRAERTEVFEEFKYSTHPRILLAHSKTLSHGLNFEHCSTICWYSPTLSVSQYEQANARISRPGQKNNMLVIRLIGADLERRIYSRIDGRLSLQGTLLSMFTD